MEIFKALFFSIQQETSKGNKDFCISHDKDKKSDQTTEDAEDAGMAAD